MCAIQTELAERFEQYDLSIMLNLETLLERNPKVLTDDLPALQRLHAKFYGLQQSAVFLYKNDQLSREFWEQYDLLMENTMGLLVEYIAFIKSIREETKTTNDMQNKLLGLSAKLRYNIEYNDIVVKSAQRYIETLHHLYSEEEAIIKNKIDNIKL